MSQTRDFVIGVDIGGTFTDAIAVADDGHIRLGKVSTTPDDFSVGFFGSIGEAAEKMGLSVPELLGNTRKLAHGTTVGMNALVTGGVAKTALLTTKGHGDAIRVMGGEGRIQGASIEELLDYRLSSRPDPVVARESVFELTERMDRDGDVVVALDEDELDGHLERIVGEGFEAVAVSLLWSFVNPDHEQRVAARVLQRCPDVFVSSAHEVAPRIGEYGRTVSAVFNAQIGPLMVSYIDRIVKGARDRGFAGDILFAQSEGGLASAEEAARLPLMTLQSGPVAGVVAAAAMGTRMGYDDVVVTDMGGTTLDVAMITKGRVGHVEEGVVARQLTYLRKIDVESVGAGGGSIAWIHENTGSLRVGPQSAGAEPGPICYGRGGTAVTVTDADLVLGVLDPDRPLAGGLKLYFDAAYEGVAALGRSLGLDALGCAAGIVEIIDSRMEDLIRRVTVQRGQDPRSFVLWGYGGASGAHAGLYGKGIGVREVVFPLGNVASVWSAYGLPQLSRLRTFAQNVSFRTPFDLASVGAALEPLEDTARGYARSVGIDVGAVKRRADMKFPLQVHTVETVLPDGAVDEDWAAALLVAFNAAYEARFGKGTGYAAAGAVMTALRVTVEAPPKLVPLPAVDLSAGPDAPSGERLVYWRETAERTATPVYAGLRHSETSVCGPALVEYPNTTIVVRPGQSLRADQHGNLVLSLRRES